MEYLILAFGFLYGAYAALEMRRVFMGPRKICIGLGTKMASAIWGALLTALMVWLIASGLMPPMNWLFVVIAIMAFLGGLMNFAASFRIEHQLGFAPAVSQIDKNDIAMISAFVHPAAKYYFFTYLFLG